MATAKKTAAKKPAAKKPATKKPAPTLYIMVGEDCGNGDLFHPDVDTPNSPRSERAVVYGPYHTLEEAVKDQDGNAFDLDYYDKDAPLVLYVKQGDSFKQVKLIGTRAITIL